MRPQILLGESRLDSSSAKLCGITCNGNSQIVEDEIVVHVISFEHSVNPSKLAGGILSIQLEYAALDAVVLVHIFVHVRDHSPSTDTDGHTKMAWKSHIISYMDSPQKSKLQAKKKTF